MRKQELRHKVLCNLFVPDAKLIHTPKHALPCHTYTCLQQKLNVVAET